MPQIKISEKFKPLFNPPQGVDTYVITGGRFSQKSFAVSLAAVLWSVNREDRVLFSRFTNVSAKDSIIPEIEEKISLLGYDKYFETNQSRIESNFNKSKIVFKGMKAGAGNQTANLKGLKDFSVWILDEAEELDDYEVAEKTMLSIRGNSANDKFPNMKIFIMNPTTNTHWIYEKYFEEMGVNAGSNIVKDNVCYIHTSYLDCLEFVPDDILLAFDQMKQKKPERYNHIVLGGWLDKAEGAILNNWRYGEFIDTGISGHGLDFGFSVDPTALVEMSVDKKKRICYWRLKTYNTGLTTDQIFRECKQVDKNGLIIADNSEPRLIAELRQKGLNIRPCRKGKGSVAAGLISMMDYEHVIDYSSTKLGVEFNNYVWNDKKAKIPVDDYNHGIDAGRYIFTKLVDNRDFSLKRAN